MRRPARPEWVVTLRPSTSGDVEFIGGLAEELFAVYSARPRRHVLAMLEVPGTLGIVAEHDGEPVGFVVVTFEALGRDFGPLQRPVVAHLDAVAVAPHARGFGVGHTLLERVVDLAVAKPAVTISLRTAEGNDDARRLFRSCGFLTAATLGPHYGKGQTAIAMFKPLVLAP